MKMTYTAKDANATAFEYEMQEGRRIVATAEATITADIEPRIKAAAMSGKHRLDVNFHPNRARIYNVIRGILTDNGYNASIPRDRSILNIKW